MNLNLNRSALRIASLFGFCLLAACSSISNGNYSISPLACDMQGVGQLQIDNQTKIVAVQSFKTGDEIRLVNSPAPHLKASVDVCMVKLIVGPGNPGPANAPSTTPGIGIEVWMPARDQWNQVIRSYGSGGWAGGYYADPTRIGQTGGPMKCF